nr:hypothetical protein [Methanohalophilus profundi]
MTKEESRIKQVRTMADYQFGKGCGNILFSGDITFKLSRTKRIRQIFSGGNVWLQYVPRMECSL